MIDRPRRTALFAVTAAVAGLAGGYATGGWTGQFLAVPIDNAIISLTPAAVVNYMIANVGERAHYLHFLGAVGIAGGLYAAVATLGLVVGREGSGLGGAVIATALSGGLSLAATGALVPSLAAAGSVGGAVAIGSVGLADGDEPAPTDSERRAAVGAITGTVAYAGISLTLGSRVTRSTQDVSDEGLALDDQSEIQSLLATADEAALDVDGVQPPVSPIETFYTIDINSTPPAVEAEDWSLTIRGAVEEEVTVDYDDLRERETEHRFMALRCIGEDRNENKMDTGLWTGTSVTPLLDQAGPQTDYVELHSADGYVSTFSREYIENGLLAYGMNGSVLPREHGHPVRMLMPGSWGKLNNKWVTDVVFVDEPTEGYWEERGWESEAPITSVAKLWTGEPGDRVNRLEDGRLEVGGHAYAGTRGVERVEVSTDGGETWTDAELADPLPGEDVTRQWCYRYEADEQHEVVARVVDGEGTVQTEEETGSFPDGASGWVSAIIEP